MADDATAAAPDMDLLMGGKPKCGSGEEVGEYDLGLHVAGLCKFEEYSLPPWTVDH